MKQGLEKIVNSLKEVKKDILKFVRDNAKVGIILGSLAFGNVVYGSTGKLDIQNYSNPIFRNITHTAYHMDGCSEGYVEGEDIIYDENVLFNGSKVNSKIVSKIPEYEFLADGRPLNNNFADLELSLHSESGNPINVSNLKNKLICALPLAGAPYFYDFGNKPITLQQQDLSDLNKDGKVDFRDFAILAKDYRETGNALAGDISGPNGVSDGKVDFHDVAYFSGGWLNKRVYPVYDVKRAINAQGGDIGVIPLPNLDGTYISEKTHTKFKLRFDRFLSDLDDDGKVDFVDLSYISNDWLKTSGQYVADISGPNGIPDGNVNYYDYSAFADDYLKDIADPNTW